jgi:plastocyanin
MSFSSCKVAVAFIALVPTFCASSLWAETHPIMIHDGAFFPEVTYLSPGDKVEFKNMSYRERTIEGKEQVQKGKKKKNIKTESWESHKLGYNETFTYTVHEGTLTTFKETSWNFVGQFSFEAPVLRN